MPLFRFIAFLGLILILLWSGGLIWFITSIQSWPHPPTRKHDAIIILTGGTLRITEGVTLFQQGKGKTLFISGVGNDVPLSALLDNHDVDPLEQELVDNIIIGYEATNTKGNAEETANWLDSYNYHDILLITSNYHMPRSLLEFRHRMPHVNFTPYSVIPEHVKLEGWWRYPGTRKLILEEYHKYLYAALNFAIMGK